MRREDTICIADAISAFVKENHLESGLLMSRIFDAWDETLREMACPMMSVGEAAALTSSKYYKEGVLTCRMTSSLIRTQLRFQIEPLRARINAKLGGGYVTRIVLN